MEPENDPDGINVAVDGVGGSDADDSEDNHDDAEGEEANEGKFLAGGDSDAVEKKDGNGDN